MEKKEFNQVDNKKNESNLLKTIKKVIRLPKSGIPREKEPHIAMGVMSIAFALSNGYADGCQAVLAWVREQKLSLDSENVIKQFREYYGASLEDLRNQQNDELEQYMHMSGFIGCAGREDAGTCVNASGKESHGVYEAKAVISYAIEAESEEEAVERLGECIANDLENAPLSDFADISVKHVHEGFLD